MKYTHVVVTQRGGPSVLQLREDELPVSSPHSSHRELVRRAMVTSLAGEESGEVR